MAEEKKCVKKVDNFKMLGLVPKAKKMLPAVIKDMLIAIEGLERIYPDFEKALPNEIRSTIKTLKGLAWTYLKPHVPKAKNQIALASVFIPLDQKEQWNRLVSKVDVLINWFTN